MVLNDHGITSGKLPSETQVSARLLMENQQPPPPLSLSLHAPVLSKGKASVTMQLISMAECVGATKK